MPARALHQSPRAKHTMTPDTHVVIPTHTTRHLHRTLLGYAT